MSTIVLSVFKPSDAYKADLSLANEGMKMISAQEGVLLNSHGIAAEGNVAVTIEIASSPEAFGAIAANKELFDGICSTMEVCRDGGFEMYHTIAPTDPKIALSGPVTEINLATLKNPETKETFETICNAFVKITEGQWTYGWSAEDPNKAIIVAAWDSVEAHWARTKEPDVADAVKEMFALIDTNGGPFHFNLVAV